MLSVTQLSHNKFKELAKNFLTQLEQRMSEKHVSLEPHWSIDHLCYRVATVSDYEQKKRQFSQFGNLLIESEVNGRPISTFKLSQSLRFLDRTIDLVELPAPKKGKITSEGFEHIEVVCDQPFHEIKTKYDGSEFDEKGLQKNFNPELELKLNDMAIKFHQLSLESVVTLEMNQKVFSALNKSEVLSKCRRFSPLVAGTFPLGIHTATSDLDILLCHHDIYEALSQLNFLYSDYPSFESNSSAVENYGIARFVVDGIAFELYIESTESVRQRAYSHFQIEERLLKLGGIKLKELIVRYRA